MFLKEDQVNYLVSNFMPRIKEHSKGAMIDVACHGMSILSSANKHNVSHQSLSKNLIRLKQHQKNIVTASKLMPSSYLLHQTAHALSMAEIEYVKAKTILIDMCITLGGQKKVFDTGIELFLDKTLTHIYLNPKGFNDYEWTFSHCDISD